MNAKPAKVTKKSLAEKLADAEVSVQTGEQTRAYWVNAWMRDSKAELEARVARLGL